MDWIETLDKNLFLFLNGFHSSFFDLFFSWTNKVITWIPLYLLFLFLMIKKFRSKSWIPLVMTAILVVSTDQSSVLIKNSVKRYRPSHHLQIKEKTHLIQQEKGGQFGFVSSHASNIWGIAVFIILVLKVKDKKALALLLFWAMVVSYGRIYSGVHYPLDVIGGALLGIGIAYIIFKVLTRLLPQFYTREIKL